MTPEDKAALTAVVTRLPRWSRVALLSPSPEERALFPGATLLSRKEWDLGRRTSQHFDLVVACNVLMYASEPEAWLANVLASTAYFLFINPVRRQRAPGGELGADGDASRTSFAGEACRVDRVHALESAGDGLLFAKLFPGGRNEHGESLHVIALVRGDLQAPRIWLRHLVKLEGQPEALAGAFELLAELEARKLLCYVGAPTSGLGRDALRSLQGLAASALPVLEVSNLKAQRSSWSPLALITGAEHARFATDALAGRDALQAALGRKVTGLGVEGKLAAQAGQRLAEAGFSFVLGPDIAQNVAVPVLRAPELGSLPREPWSAVPAPAVAVDLDAPRVWDAQLDALEALRRARLSEADELRRALARA